MSTANIRFIGGGNMATSLIAGLIADGYAPQAIQVSDPSPERRHALQASLGVRALATNAEALAGAETLVLCVKPQLAASVCAELAPLLDGQRPLIVSVMAGVPEQTLQRWLGASLPIVRAMPNTPAMVQTGAIGLHASPEVDAEGRNRAETILRAVGLVRWVEDESHIDAVTAISGSGPAYFFLFMEALEQAAIELGLDGETARLLTIQTALGAAKMAMESTDPPARLREQVTSPGGTTERALAVFDEADLRALVERAARAARDRAVELSKTLSEAP
ncbi:pyrroline-5-carboxylate reductase [Allochromatium vinosum]|uniref:Pyrroline-5-carboxylate reductase n=1 Tax=Allochromatium vinosum (strain ATCC 17899 / DSM 180 / NBRC 103801 / NCIMB 10441 / D) TaxID=572477 RepID=D3RQW6_ALLVD|nr:pyrroline-5-carboxylate reductase [Allochromatium vinosum]ADC63800.1 pyrroline-5-carboxylate reductase [Allochromatium vinosum DSM 180]